MGRTDYFFDRLIRTPLNPLNYGLTGIITAFMHRRNNRQNEIEINLDDVELIMGKDYSRLDIFLKSVFCSECSGMVTIRNFKIYLDDTHDIIFDGRCERCTQPVSRYIETGESPSASDIARHIRTVKSEFINTKPGKNERE